MSEFDPTKGYKKVGSFRHPKDDYHHTVWQHKEKGTYHHEDEHGGYPDDSTAHKSPDHALKHFKKFHAEFNHRENGGKKADHEKFASGYKFHPEDSKMHKSEEEAIESLEKGEKGDRHHSSFHHGKIGHSKFTDIYVKDGKYSHKTYESDGSGPVHSGEGFDSPFHAKQHAKSEPMKKGEEPRSQEYKGHTIERTGDHQYQGSGFDTKKVATPHRTEYSVMHTDGKGTLHLHPTTFSSAEHAKAHIDKKVSMKKSDMHKAEKDAIDQFMKAEKPKMPLKKAAHCDLKKDELCKAEAPHFGVRSFDHTKKQKGTGKHWTVAHSAPKSDHGYHTHTHHFDTAHQAMKYAQKWEDDVGQHNNDRPEILGPEHDEK